MSMLCLRSLPSSPSSTFHSWSLKSKAGGNGLVIGVLLLVKWRGIEVNQGDGLFGSCVVIVAVVVVVDLSVHLCRHRVEVTTMWLENRVVVGVVGVVVCARRKGLYTERGE